MEAIDFIKKYHKQYIGNINKDIVDEEGFNYYYYYIKYCCIEYNEIKDTYLLNITEDVYNDTIYKVNDIEGSKFIDEWTTEYKESILYAKEYRFKTNILILWKEVIK